MTEFHYICEFAELTDPGTRGFTLNAESDDPVEGFVVRRGDSIYAYKDSCPHTGVGLAWLPNEYLDLDGMYIECSTHGALFTPEAGYCVAGPCAGQSLTALGVKVIEGRVMLVGEPA